MSNDQYIVVSELHEVNVSGQDPPPAVAVYEIYSDARGEWIATRTGTPHLMGFRVHGEPRYPVHVGQRWINGSGKNDRGDTISYGEMVCVQAGDPSIFLQDFPGQHIHVHVHR